MADVKISDGTQLLFADHATDFSSGAPGTAANSVITGTPTDVQMDLTSLAASGGAREAAKTATLGALRDTLYQVDACIEFTSAPTAGGTVDFYWAGSRSGTAGTGNPGNLTGADASYTDSSEELAQMDYIGSLSCSNDAVNIGMVGTFMAKHAYGVLVVVNNADANFNTDAAETHVAATPIVTGTE